MVIVIRESAYVRIAGHHARVILGLDLVEPCIVLQRSLIVCQQYLQIRQLNDQTQVNILGRVV